MKRRTKNKIAKRKNQERHQKLLNTLNEYCLTPTVLRYLDGYFIFDFDKSSVCHFNIKELPGWLFGIWLGDNKNQYSIFGEPEEYIDKFKPSAVQYSYENIDEFAKQMVEIRDNFDYYMANDWYAHDEDLQKEDIEKIAEVIENHKLKLEQEAEEDFEDWKYTFNFFKSGIFEEIPQLEAVGVFDWNVGGMECSPRFLLTLQVNKDDYENFDFEKPIDLYTLKQKIKDGRNLEFKWLSSYDFDFGKIIGYSIDIDKKHFTYIFKRPNQTKDNN